MKISSIFLFASLALPAALSAADAPMMQPAEETMPKQKIVSLTIEPEKVVLDGKFAAAQVIVFAKLQSGEGAEVSKSGHIKARKSGAATLNAEISGQKASAAIEVSAVVENVAVDFIRDVNPVMTKLGCNAGTCQGAKDGKYGPKLSLRGYDPIFDVRSLKMISRDDG